MGRGEETSRYHACSLEQWSISILDGCVDERQNISDVGLPAFPNGDSAHQLEKQHTKQVHRGHCLNITDRELS